MGTADVGVAATTNGRELTAACESTSPGHRRRSTASMARRAVQSIVCSVAASKTEQLMVADVLELTAWRFNSKLERVD